MKALLACLLLLPLIGCAGLTDMITPAQIPKDAASYVGEDNVQKTGLFGKFTSKNDLEDVIAQAKSKHKRTVLELQQAADLDKLNFEIASEVSEGALFEANELQTRTINPAMQVGMSAIPGLAGLGLGARYIKRPGDKSKDEHDSAVKAAGLDDPENYKESLV